MLNQMEWASKGFRSIGILEKLEHEERLFLKAKITVAGKSIPAKLLLDYIATSLILREVFVQDKQILNTWQKNPISIWNTSQLPIVVVGIFYT